MLSRSFKAVVIEEKGEDVKASVQTLQEKDLPEGDVLVHVKYSSVNYKDGLASIKDGNIVSSYPFVPGIDLAGTVISSKSKRFSEGDDIIVTGYELGVSHYGGFSEYATVDEDWIVPLPEKLTLKEAMAYGTAGFTAALAIHKLEHNGLTPEAGTVLVTGASGGVGSLAVAMLAKKGYDVTASTGKEAEHDYLRRLGAKEVLSRKQLQPEKIRLMDRQKWAAAVDPVGGDILAYILSTLQYGGSVATCGHTSGVNIPTNVFPFILRGVQLLGVDSVYCPQPLRTNIWQRLATDLKPTDLLEMVTSELSLTDLPDHLQKVVRKESKGRYIVKM